MDESLNNIIRNGSTIADSIHWYSLQTLTAKGSSADLNKELWIPFWWENLRVLYIMGSEESLEIKQRPDWVIPGWYISERRNWLLIVGAPKKRIEELLSHRADNLEQLTIRFTDFESLDFGHFEGLKRLDLHQNRELSKIIQFPPNLQQLDLKHTNIREVPTGLYGLTKLEQLDLSHLTLNTLPDWLPELGLRFHRGDRCDGIDLRNTTVNDVDMSIFDQPHSIILQWFEERKKTHSAHERLHEVKVIFLGDGEAGKSYTIARLLNNGEKLTDFDGDSTPGIMIRNLEQELDGEKIQIRFWDFGGQELLHSMHRMFLTDRTVYVVLLNARNDTQDDRAQYWLRNISGFAPNAPVMLVLNKIDQNPNASINENDLRERYPNLKQVIAISALKDSPVSFNRALRDPLMAEIRQLGIIGTFFPAPWRKVRDALQNAESPYISGKTYRQLCKIEDIPDNITDDLLNWFKDLGVCFFYDRNARMRNYLILRPDWITNALYTILFNKHTEVHNGLISHEAIHSLLNGGKNIRQTLPGLEYDANETEYVLSVLRSFRLSYQLWNADTEEAEGTEFIPMLCKRNAKPVAMDYARDLHTLEFRMIYEYLPNNVLHRLMYMMRQDLDTDNVWLTGARFVQKATGLSAVVKQESNMLRIFTRTEQTVHRPNTYLAAIKGCIEDINRQMGLQVAISQVIYKSEGTAECFDYDELVQMQEAGQAMRFSRRRGIDIPIADILSQTGRPEEQRREALLREIINACRKMQANKHYWDFSVLERSAKEDIRNTYIRDLLSTKYVIRDQSFIGLSQGRKQSGEVDLDIRIEKDVPWTIYEALNMSGTADLKKWDTHLRKLLDNYNPNGLPFLFLVSYMECRKEDFSGIWNICLEHIRWHDPENYSRMEESCKSIPLEGGEYIRAAQCSYDRGGTPTMVYHICVRLGD